jgi:hypothetical protein
MESNATRIVSSPPHAPQLRIVSRVFLSKMAHRRKHNLVQRSRRYKNSSYSRYPLVWGRLQCGNGPQMARGYISSRGSKVVTQWTIWLKNQPQRDWPGVFVEETQFEMSRLTRKTFAQTKYDATACYDRIIPNLAVLASCAHGVPKEVTVANTCTLKCATFHVRTDVGVCTEGYTHTNDAPIFGTGQGSGTLPAIWCFILSLLYHTRGGPQLYWGEQQSWRWRIGTTRQTWPCPNRSCSHANTDNEIF